LGLRSAVAILIAITGVSLAVGSANAETAALAEREAPDSADSGVRDTTPTAGKAEQRRERRELRSQRGEERLARVRVVLFEGIELSAEQSRGLDAIIEAELKHGRRIDELRAALEAARRRGDTERIRAIGAERRSLLEQRKGPNKSMEEMRALLTEEQRPTFDMNRARLAAESQQAQKESQQAQKGRRDRGPRAGAAVEAE
jgi:hypothetical protein